MKMDMFEAIATSPAPEHRRFDDLPADAMQRVRKSAPEGVYEMEFMRTCLDDGTYEEVFVNTLIAQPWGPQYVPAYIHNAAELEALLKEIAA